MPAGTPIRLVRESGDTIELDAQSMVLTTTRKVGGKPLPFAGSRRIGMDLNMNSAMINIQGIISDDRTASGGSPGQAVINFGRQQGARSGIEFAEQGANADGVNLAGLISGEQLKIKKMDGSYGVVSFTITNGSTAYDATGNGGQPSVMVNLSTAGAAELAIAVAAFINARFPDDFTATTITDEDYRGIELPNISVSIEMGTVGEVLNNATPYFHGGTKTFHPPAIIPFFGGTTGTKKSAGDKAMDLYGVLNNSTTQAGRIVQTGILAVAGGLLGFGAVAATAAAAGSTATAAATVGSTGIGGGLGIIGGGGALFGEKDYILGIQIPYNSMIQTTDGELYTARNFFMPTGGLLTSGTTAFQKTSNSNTGPASATMNWETAEKAGIQGSVQKMDITYNAGETVYEFNMIFAPVDNLL